MKRVVYLAPIDHIVGKLPQSTNIQGYVSGMNLQGRLSTKNKDEINRLTLAKIGKRSTEVTESEIAARNRFAAVATAIKEATLDPVQKRLDGEAFHAQTEIKTYKAFMWNKYGIAYDEEQAENENANA